MNDMQKKLEQYRLVKRRKEKFEDIKLKFKKFLMLGTGSKKEDELRPEHHVVDVNGEKASDQKKLLESDDENFSSDAEELILSTDDEQEAVMVNPDTDANAALIKEDRWFKYICWTVYIMFWSTLFIIAIELQFGIVFLMLSALFGIYYNTRTGPRKNKEISAYSVFNKNCESIDGTLKAEQFEREMRYGPGSVR